jgi:peroxin-1
MLASAVAGECGLNFISVKGPEILNKYIALGCDTVKLIEEEDARASGLGSLEQIANTLFTSSGVTDRVVNQLLTQMDGAEGLSGVYVLAATSRPDLIVRYCQTHRRRGRKGERPGLSRTNREHSFH